MHTWNWFDLFLVSYLYFISFPLSLHFFVALFHLCPLCLSSWSLSSLSLFSSSSCPLTLSPSFPALLYPISLVHFFIFFPLRTFSPCFSLLVTLFPLFPLFFTLFFSLLRQLLSHFSSFFFPITSSSFSPLFVSPSLCHTHFIITS